MIVYYYMVPNFVFEGKIVLFVVFVGVHVGFKNIWLITIIWLINIFPVIFSWFIDILLLILIETQQLK